MQDFILIHDKIIMGFSTLISDSLRRGRGFPALVGALTTKA